MGISMEKVFILIQKVKINLKENLKMEKQTEKGRHYIIMEINMKAIIKIGKKKEKEFIIIITGINMKEIL